MKRAYALLGVLVLAGCAERAPDAGAEPALVLTEADSAAVAEQAGAIATAVAQGLVQRLQARLEAEGPVGAVAFCSETALVLTDSLVADEPIGTKVKRTSFRVRNPANAPDSLEALALAWFDSAQAAGGALPPALVQLAGPDEVRFYRPLMVMGFCTQCHGTQDAIDPGVKQVLAERYPADRATGYREGDFRGLIRVSLPR